MSVDLLDVDEMRHRGQHPADLGAVFLDDDVADALQPEGTERLALVLLPTDAGLDLTHLETTHHSLTSARALSSAAGATCSTVRPRWAAMSSGVFSICSAATVAPTMFSALD